MDLVWSVQSRRNNTSFYQRHHEYWKGSTQEDGVDVFFLVYDTKLVFSSQNRLASRWE